MKNFSSDTNVRDKFWPRYGRSRRVILVIVSLILLVIILVSFGVGYLRPSLDPPELRPVPQGFNYVIPISEFQKDIDAANDRMITLYGTATCLRRWQTRVMWAGILLSLVATVFLLAWKGPVQVTAGGTDEPSAAPDVNARLGLIESSLTANQRLSKMAVRLLAVMVFLSSATATVSQRLESDAMRYVAAGGELNKAVLAAQDVLYTENATAKDAKRALQALKEVIQRPW